MGQHPIARALNIQVQEISISDDDRNNSYRKKVIKIAAIFNFPGLKNSAKFSWKLFKWTLTHVFGNYAGH